MINTTFRIVRDVVFIYDVSMPKTRLTEDEKNKIFDMRRNGCTLSEIVKEVHRSKSTVFSYMNKVDVLNEFRDVLEQKQCGSRYMSKTYWEWSRVKSSKFVGDLTDREKILLLASLYWGEGRKSGEFGIINSDPYVIKVVMDGLLLIGIDKSRLKIGLRIFKDLDINRVTNFWSNFLNIDRQYFGKPEIIQGKKKGKLEFGMCRLRIEKGQKYFKLMTSMIDLIKQQY